MMHRLEENLLLLCERPSLFLFRVGEGIYLLTLFRLLHGVFYVGYAEDFVYSFETKKKCFAYINIILSMNKSKTGDVALAVN